MPKLIPLLALGGAAYYAHTQGWLDDAFDAVKPALDPVIDTVKPRRRVIDTGGEETVDDSPYTDTDPDAKNDQPHVKMVRDHFGVISPWARANVKWVAAICMVENRKMNPKARGSAGELGVMQVKLGTARDLHEWGYTTMLPTAGVLKTTAGGLHYGTAYLQYLSTFEKPREWITKAYNGGPGWAGLSKNYRNKREAYFKKVQKAFQSLKEDG